MHAPTVDVVEARHLRTPRERVLRRIAIGFSILAWTAIVVSVVGAIYGLLIAGAVVVVNALYLAHVRGNGVRVGPRQLPHLWRRVEEAARRFGLATPPETYVLAAGGPLNAFAMRFFSRRVVVLNAELVEACAQAARRTGDDRPKEIDFVIGHEVGHIACGHLSLLLLPARALPLLGPAFSRACEYTCDRAGYLAVGDLEVASSALGVLAAGPAARALDLDAYCAQREETGGFWMAVHELTSTHPYLPKRIAALRDWLHPGTVRPVERNLAAYPLAPFFAIAGGGAAASAMMAVALVGVMAAVAIPSFQRYVARAQAQAAPATEARVHGERAAWSMAPPSGGWQVLDGTVARQRNPLADRWLTRADLDAHIIVVAEPLEPGGTLTMKEFEAAVRQNALQAQPSFTVQAEELLPSGARLLRATADDGSNHIAYRYGLYLGAHGAYQIVMFAPAKNMDVLDGELRRVLASFRD